MKINKNHNKNRRLLITLLIVGILLFAGAAAAFIVIRSANNYTQTSPPPELTTPSTKINLEAPTQEQLNASQQKKEDSLTQDKTDQQPASSLSITITSSNQNNASSQLQIRTLIDAVLGSGSCSLTLQKGAVVVSRSVDIQAGPSNSTCEGFDIPLSDLSAGTWAITVQLTSGSHFGKATSQVVINAN